MAVAEDIDRESAVEGMVDGNSAAAAESEIVVDAAVAEDAEVEFDVAAAHVAGVVEAASGLAVAVLETVVGPETVAATDGEAVDTVSIGGEAAGSIGLGVVVVAVAEDAERVLAVAGWTVQIEHLAEHYGFDVAFAEGIQDELVVQDDKIEDVVAEHLVAGSVADGEDSLPMDTVGVAAAEEQVYAQEK
jgi:threonine dehydrogenase-like Zn-dependent dehydrogenase